MHKTGSVGKVKILRPPFNIEKRQIVQVCSHTGDDIASYDRPAFVGSSKTAEKAVSDGSGSNVSSAAFCVPQPIGGLLVWELSWT